MRLRAGCKLQVGGWREERQRVDLWGAVVFARVGALARRGEMGDVAIPESALAEMEALQDEVLSRLEELNARIELLLAEEMGSSANAVHSTHGK